MLAERTGKNQLRTPTSWALFQVLGNSIRQNNDVEILISLYFCIEKGSLFAKMLITTALDSVIKILIYLI